MLVTIEKKARKYLEKLDVVMQERIKEAFLDLALEPPRGDIIKLEGASGFRRRVGKYRILFDVTDNGIVVYKIAPRGEAYKE